MRAELCTECRSGRRPLPDANVGTALPTKDLHGCGSPRRQARWFADESPYRGPTIDVWGTGSLIWIAVIESVVLAVVVACRPTDGGIGGLIKSRNKPPRCEDRR